MNVVRAVRFKSSERATGQERQVRGISPGIDADGGVIPQAPGELRDALAVKAGVKVARCLQVRRRLQQSGRALQ